MITVTNHQLEQAIPFLNQLLAQKLPAKAAFKVVKVAKEVEVKFETHKQTLEVLRNTHALKDADGNLVPSLDENGQVVENMYQVADPELFQSELTEVYNLTVELDFEPFDPETLGDEFELVPGDLLNCEWLFTL